jgi:cytochrome c5
VQHAIAAGATISLLEEIGSLKLDGAPTMRLSVPDPLDCDHAQFGRLAFGFPLGTWPADPATENRMRGTSRPVPPLVLCAGLCAAGASAFAQPADLRFANPTRFMTQTGEAIYADVCQGCHIAGGEGATGAGTYLALARNPKLHSCEYAYMKRTNSGHAHLAIDVWSATAMIVEAV